MDRKVCKYLSDILTAILEIESFMATRPRMYETILSSESENLDLT